MIQSGRMENLTTTRIGFTPKSAKKREQIIPSGQIRLSTGRIDNETTTGISYMNPGPAQPTFNYKPIGSYCPSSEPISSETTSKLSYPPLRIPLKENYIWAKTPTYKYFYEIYSLIQTIIRILFHFKNFKHFYV